MARDHQISRREANAAEEGGSRPMLRSGPSSELFVEIQKATPPNIAVRRVPCPNEHRRQASMPALSAAFHRTDLSAIPCKDGSGLVQRAPRPWGAEHSTHPPKALANAAA